MKLLHCIIGIFIIYIFSVIFTNDTFAQSCSGLSGTVTIGTHRCVENQVGIDSCEYGEGDITAQCYASGGRCVQQEDYQSTIGCTWSGSTCTGSNFGESPGGSVTCEGSSGGDGGGDDDGPPPPPPPPQCENDSGCFGCYSCVGGSCVNANDNYCGSCGDCANDGLCYADHAWCGTNHACIDNPDVLYGSNSFYCQNLCGCSYTEDCDADPNPASGDAAFILGERTCNGVNGGNGACAYDSSGACQPLCGSCKAKSARCSYTQSCALGNGQYGTQTCNGVRNGANTCVYDPSGAVDPSCSTCVAPTSVPPTAVPPTNVPPTAVPPTLPPASAPTVSARTGANCDGSIEVWWTQSSGATSYSLYRGTTSNFTPSSSNLIQANMGANPNSANPFIDWNDALEGKGSPNMIGQRYYYKVVAVSSGGNATSTAANAVGSAACGGNTPVPTSPACLANNDICTSNGQCCTGNCKDNSNPLFASRCAPSTCNNDGVCNAGETAATCSNDCGGGGSNPCTGNSRENGCTCTSNLQCRSGNCENGVCQPAEQPTRSGIATVRVFEDTNRNNVKDTTESLYSGSASVTFREGTTTVGSDTFVGSVNRRIDMGSRSGSKSISVTLTAIPGRTLTSTNPQTQTVVVNNTTTYDFGLVPVVNSPTPTTRPVHRIQAQVYNDVNGNRVLDSSDRSIGRVSGQSVTIQRAGGVESAAQQTTIQGVAEFNPTLAGTYTVRIKTPYASGLSPVTGTSQIVVLTGSADTETAQFLMSAVTNTPVTGTIRIADGSGVCTTSSAPLAGAAVELSSTSGTYSGNTTTTTAGNYSLSSTTTGNHVINASHPNYTVLSVQLGSGSYTPYSPGVGYTFNLSSPQTVNFCVRTNTTADNAWFRTEIGSVRLGLIDNIVPPTASENPTTTNNTASVYYATEGSVNLGSAESIKWQVEREANDQRPVAGGGNVSYSFYKQRAAQGGLTLQQLCPDPNCTIANLNSVAGGAIYHVPGNLTISGNSAMGNKKIIIIADGNITINGDISTGAGGILILAAQQNVVIGAGVGSAANSSAFNIAAILSAEEDVVIEGRTTTGVCPTNDERLNINGTIIANAARPFATGESGDVINNRTLCASNAQYPVLYVQPRLNFIVNLTDLYTTSTNLWNEVAP